MQYAQLGSSGLTVSRLGFGCMGLTGSYGAADRAEAVAALRAAADAGVTLFDTADVYGGGENERLVGEILRSQRERVVLATKGGATRGPEGQATNDGSPEYLVRACEASLRRLGVDTIDLYYLHRIDPAVPVEESVGALGRLVQQGKVRAIGLSEVSVATLRRALAVHPIAAVQTEYSLACRFAEDDILSTCRELGVAFVAYSPLGRGLLSGSVSEATVFVDGDLRRAIPRFQSSNLACNIEASGRLGALARQLGLTPAQLALAWLLHKPWELFAIPGSRNASRAAANAAAADLTLPAEVISRLDEAFGGEAIQGERHTLQMLARTGL